MRQNNVSRLAGRMTGGGRTGRVAFVAAVALSATLVSACDGDPAGPMEAVSGHYEAAEWIITNDSDSWDLLAGGGHLRITLRPDGTTTGEYFIPAGVSPAPGIQPETGPADRRVDLAGTWSVEGFTVKFDHPTDTYLKFVDWEVTQPGELFNVHVNGGYSFRTVLER